MIVRFSLFFALLIYWLIYSNTTLQCLIHFCYEVLHFSCYVAKAMKTVRKHDCFPFSRMTKTVVFAQSIYKEKWGTPY